MRYPIYRGQYITGNLYAGKHQKLGSYDGRSFGDGCTIITNIIIIPII